jgi:energy-coupling factor transporter ATP-binding protein EcfA2
MSLFNLDGVGRRVATIVGDKSKYTGKLLCLHNDDDDDSKISRAFSKLELPTSPNLKFQQVPDTAKEREILYITGASGSGKSTYVRKYCEIYKKKYKDRPIYLFSNLKEDESLDSIEPQRIKIDSNLIDDPINAEDLTESICIFDDVDCIKDKKVREAVIKVMNECLEVGRHFKITMLITNHLPTDRQFTRRVINECHAIIYFPQSALGMQTNYMLTNYAGLDTKVIKKIRRTGSRWCMISKNYPRFYMTERCVNMLSNEEDD